MSTPGASPQHEPTMEEILASIRKIISEDQPEPAKPEPPKASPPLRAVPSEPPPAPVAKAPQPEVDVLELTEELPEEQASALSKSAPLAADDIAFETIEPPPKAEPVYEADADDLISDTTRTAVGRAFANMGKSPSMPMQITGGTIEAIFVQAVQGAFVPTLQDWVESHREEIMEIMKPLIRAWMDEHLPPLIEAALAKEIARAASENTPKRR